MPENIDIIITAISTALGSSVLTAIVNNFICSYRDRRKERKELIAKASASVLKRVELCYRIRRRADDEDTIIKNLAHDIQEENEYYRCLLLTESEWFGNRYSLYLKAVKQLTSDAMSKAWTKKGNPSASMENSLKLDHIRLEKLSSQFALDSRRFLCFPRRAWMWLHDKTLGVKEYDI